MNKKINLTIGIITSLLFLFIYNVSAFSYQCENVRKDTIRLHIIASSDTKKDQEIKLKVRDKILAESPGIFDGSITTENAKQLLTPQLDKIKHSTDTILNELQAEYDSQVSLETEYFDTRIYENGITMPAGKYLALKITLGEGKGKNWWCIMFPSLCLPAAEQNNTNVAETVYSDSEKKIIMTTDKYEIRFKIIEYIEKIKTKVDNTCKGDNE